MAGNTEMAVGMVAVVVVVKGQKKDGEQKQREYEEREHPPHSHIRTV